MELEGTKEMQEGKGLRLGKYESSGMFLVLMRN